MNPSTARAFTKLLLLLLLVCAGATILIKDMQVLTSAQSTENSNQERKFKKKEFVGMPVRVREVKHLQSETWPNDLEIEVENVSSKPIYFINAVLEFPDDPAPNGKSGIILKYGNSENMDIGRIAEAEDEHLDPGKKIVLVVSDVYREGLLAKQKKHPENLKKLEFWFEIINFGDGTGFEASQFLDLRRKNVFLPVSGGVKKKRWHASPLELEAKEHRRLRVSDLRASKYSAPTTPCVGCCRSREL